MRKPSKCSTKVSRMQNHKWVESIFQSRYIVYWSNNIYVFIVFLKLHLFFLFQHKVRTETMVTFGKLCSGLGTAAASVHREVYKTVRAAMSDRVMPVREAGAFCLLSMAPYAQASTYSVVHI